MKKVKREPIKTILSISVGFIVVFLITHLNWTLLTALIVGLIGLFSTYLSEKIDFLWMKLTYVLSLIVPNILLGTIFYLFLFPISLLSRIFGKKDPLMLSNKLKSTYVVSNKSFSKKSFETPW